jgi:hypothetical protein
MSTKYPHGEVGGVKVNVKGDDNDDDDDTSISSSFNDTGEMSMFVFSFSSTPLLASSTSDRLDLGRRRVGALGVSGADNDDNDDSLLFEKFDKSAVGRSPRSGEREESESLTPSSNDTFLGGAQKATVATGGRLLLLLPLRLHRYESFGIL